MVEMGLDAVIKPKVDEKEADSEVEELADKFDALEELDMDLETDDEFQEAMEAFEENKHVVDTAQGGIEQGRDGGGGGLLEGMIGGKMAKVALAGAVGIGILKATQKLAKHSPALAQVNSMMRQAWSMFWRPFGKFLAEKLKPWAEDALKMAQRFMEISDSEGLVVAVSTLPDALEDWLTVNLGEDISGDLQKWLGLDEDISASIGFSLSEALGDIFTLENLAPSQLLGDFGQNIGDEIGQIIVDEVKSWFDDGLPDISKSDILDFLFGGGGSDEGKGGSGAGSGDGNGSKSGGDWWKGGGDWWDFGGTTGSGGGGALGAASSAIKTPSGLLTGLGTNIGEKIGQDAVDLYNEKFNQSDNVRQGVVSGVSVNTTESKNASSKNKNTGQKQSEDRGQSKNGSIVRELQNVIQEIQELRSSLDSQGSAEPPVMPRRWLSREVSSAGRSDTGARDLNSGGGGKDWWDMG
jgi:hypothetical protein